MLKNRFIALLAILIVPVIGFFLLKSGINHYVRLHFFGPKKLSGTFHMVKGKKVADTIYHRVQAFQLYDQEGALFGTKQLDGNPYIASLFFSRCPDVCPKMNTNLDSLHRVFKVHPEVKFVSITVDPTSDSVPVLKAYALKMKADSKRWKFLTGNRDSIYRLAREGFLLDVAKERAEPLSHTQPEKGAVDSTGANPQDFIHSQMLVLIDGKRHIRGYYDGVRQEEWKRLIDEVIVLRLEQMRDSVNKK